MALGDVHHPKHWMRNAPIISTHGARSWQTNGWLWNCLPPLYCTWWCHHATLRRQKACHCFPWFMQWIPTKDDPIIDETTVLEGPIFHFSTSMIIGERVNHPFAARLHIPQELLPIFHCPGLASRCQPSLFKRAMERLSILYPHCSNASGNMNCGFLTAWLFFFILGMAWAGQMKRPKIKRKNFGRCAAKSESTIWCWFRSCYTVANLQRAGGDGEARHIPSAFSSRVLMTQPSPNPISWYVK